MKKISIIAGMPRAATTFLYYTLALHPSLFVPARKELEFFSLNYERGQNWYLDFFSSMPIQNIGFDISPLYFFSERSTRRIVDFFDLPRVIIVVRKPEEFALSFYKNRLASSDPGLSFENFLGGLDYHKDNNSLAVRLAPGALMENIERFSKALGDNLLLIDFRSIQQNPLTGLKAIESFVGADDYFDHGSFNNTKINASDQLNIKFINRLMHKKWFSDLVTRVFPKNIIMAVRLKLQSTKRKSGTRLTNDDEFAHGLLAREHFLPDTDFITSLFRESQFILGSGRGFPPPPDHRVAIDERPSD